MYATFRRWLRDRYGIGAFLIYSGVSLGVLGRGVAAAPRAFMVGRTTDPTVYMWLLKWWPHAIAGRINPFVTDLVWAPGGFNLTWTTAIPLPAIAAAPITARFGPVVAYNLLCLLAPPLAAWSAFILCRGITGRWWPSLVGGYLFGFSAYMLAQILAHLPLILVFPVPLAAWLAIRRGAGRIGKSAFVVAMALTLGSTLLISLEIFATATIFGALFIGLLIVFADEEPRRSIVLLSAPLALAYAIAFALASPYLYYFLHGDSFPHFHHLLSTDLLNFLVPTPSYALGTERHLASLSTRFGGRIEAGGCLGLPLIAIAIWHGRARWSDPVVRAMLVFAGLVAIAALGPRLQVAGVTLFGMPWKIAQHLPLISDALPARFPIFISLALAVICAMWLAANDVSAALKGVALGAIAIFFAPNPSVAWWTSPVATPRFFLDGSFRRDLAPGATVLILPYGFNGSSMLWQAESGFYFRMAGGWTSFTPHEFQRWPIVDAFLHNVWIPDFPEQLKAFLAYHDSRAVLIAGATSGRWAPLLAASGAESKTIGGVDILRFSTAALAPYRQIDVIEIERRADQARFALLLDAARKFLAHGAGAASLTPLKAQALGLLPPDFVVGAGARSGNGLFLGPLGDGRVGIGVTGSLAALAPMISRYRSVADQVYFPFPRRLTPNPRGDTFMRLCVFAFTPDALGRAAAIAAPLAPGPGLAFPTRSN